MWQTIRSDPRVKTQAKLRLWYVFYGPHLALTHVRAGVVTVRSREEAALADVSVWVNNPSQRWIFVIKPADAVHTNPLTTFYWITECRNLCSSKLWSGDPPDVLFTVCRGSVWPQNYPPCVLQKHDEKLSDGEISHSYQAELVFSKALPEKTSVCD